jgi:protease I
MKVVFIIAKQDFRDEELLDTKSVLEKEYEVHIASISAGKCEGKLGAIVNADLSIDQALSLSWDAVVFVGGPGTPTVYTHPPALVMARKAEKTAKVLAAICWAPVVLAKAKVLDGLKVTGWDDGAGTQFRELKAAGATILPQHVVTDGKLVTADGPRAAKDFGKAILAVLRS